MPFGKYNLHPRVSVLPRTERTERRAKRKKNPHLDIRFGWDKIYFAKKDVVVPKKIADDPTIGPFTQAAVYQHARRTLNNKKKWDVKKFLKRRGKMRGKKSGLRNVVNVE